MISVLKSLETLLASQSAAIVRRESSVECAMHLYDVGGWWVAFERSAYLLSLLYRSGYPSVLHFKGCSGVPMVMEGIPSAALSCLCRSSKVLHAEKGYRVVSAPSYDPLCYTRWKKSCLLSDEESVHA